MQRESTRPQIANLYSVPVPAVVCVRACVVLVLCVLWYIFRLFLYYDLFMYRVILKKKEDTAVSNDKHFHSFLFHHPSFAHASSRGVVHRLCTVGRERIAVLLLPQIDADRHGTRIRLLRAYSKAAKTL